MSGNSLKLPSQEATLINWKDPQIGTLKGICTHLVKSRISNEIGNFKGSRPPTGISPV